MLAFSFMAESFRSSTNLEDLTLPITLLGLVSVGVAFGLIAGVIDLSVGSIMGVAGVTAAGLVSKGGVPAPIAIAAALALGTFLGLVNGLLVSGLRIPSFIITLGTLAVYRALALRLQEDFFGGIQSVLITDKTFTWLGSGEVIGRIPASFFVFVAIAVVGYYLLSHSKVGVWFFAVGGNEKAAHAAGISPDRIRILAFVISGFCAAMAGLVLAARTHASIPRGGLGFEFEAITAVIIGGASLYGGSGSILGTVLGVTLLTVLLNGLSHQDVQFYDQFFIRAAIFIGLLWIDANVRQRRRARLAQIVT